MLCIDTCVYLHCLHRVAVSIYILVYIKTKESSWSILQSINCATYRLKKKKKEMPSGKLGSTWVHALDVEKKPHTHILDWLGRG